MAKKRKMGGEESELEQEEIEASECGDDEYVDHDAYEDQEGQEEYEEQENEDDFFEEEHEYEEELDSPSSGGFWRGVFKFLFAVLVLAFAALFVFAIYLDRIVVEKFEGKRFALPAVVYAQPLELYEGAELNRDFLIKSLVELGYEKTIEFNRSGQYLATGSTVDIFVRPFLFWDGLQDEIQVRLVIEDSKVKEFHVVDALTPTSMIRLEPLKIGGIYPGKGEDRELVRLDQVPQSVIDALIAVEDKRFYSHYGVDPKAILRAVIAMASGGPVQGGSTITQQLVKNFYLTRERTLERKLKEMIMAVLLELHYSKEEILETYINEVYFGQDKSRAVHGFGLASQFFFARQLSQLRVEETALLVGMLKGPIYYNPRKFAERAKTRRNLVLQLMREQGYIDELEYNRASESALGVSSLPGQGQSLHPAFLDLVIRQLKRDYREEDLKSEGLQIYTTLDPFIQQETEKALSGGIDKLENYYGIKDKNLQGAAIVADVLDGEVKALVGGRDVRYQGFNRALDASRQVGSLLKPAIYLNAFMFSEKYSLASLVDDSPFVWQEPGIEDWYPQNYDRKSHGQIPLWFALAKSYNIAAARLGTELGVANVLETVKRLGLDRELPPYASSLLGATELSPLEVTQIYHTLASGGFRTPLRAIREVTTKDGIPMNRYELSVEQVVDPSSAYLIVKAMEAVISHGTGKALKKSFPENFALAGKTGTTDELRDSWFSGFSGDRVVTVWIGNDENNSIGLTGATGALKIWGDIMSSTSNQAIDMLTPEGLAYVPVNAEWQVEGAQPCRASIALPFRREVPPPEDQVCEGTGEAKSKSWIRRLFGF